MHRQYLHAGQRTIAYLDSHPGGQTVNVAVLVHAFPLSATMWEPQFKALPDGWRLIAPDLRGFGGSTIDHEPESPSMDDYAGDVIDLLRDLDVPSAVVGGCSMGGYVTFAMLRRAPHLARAVVLVDTRGGADTPEGRANRRAMLALLEREGPSGIAREMLPKILGQTTRDARSDIESNIRRLVKQQSAAAIRGAVLRMMERPDSFATIRSVDVPVLVVVGEEDTLTPVEESQKLADGLPHARLVVIRRAGHMSNLEQTDEFNRAFAAFLSRL